MSHSFALLNPDVKLHIIAEEGYQSLLAKQEKLTKDLITCKGDHRTMNAIDRDLGDIYQQLVKAGKVPQIRKRYRTPAMYTGGKGYGGK